MLVAFYNPLGYQLLGAVSYRLEPRLSFSSPCTTRFGPVLPFLTLSDSLFNASGLRIPSSGSANP